jgi:hypothetical protein
MLCAAESVNRRGPDGYGQREPARLERPRACVDEPEPADARQRSPPGGAGAFTASPTTEADSCAFTPAADKAARSRSASILNVHLTDTIINVVTVNATRNKQGKVVCQVQSRGLQRGVGALVGACRSRLRPFENLVVSMMIQWKNMSHGTETGRKRTEPIREVGA